MSESRQLAAIMFTDIVGYTSIMGADSKKALELVRISSDLQKEIVKNHNGVWLKEMGDGALIRFNTALDSVNCAIEIQKVARSDLDAKLRIGIHLGDITVAKDDILGDGVNVASRLESITDPGGIYISDAIHKAIQGQSEIDTVFLGEVQLKNVSYKVRVFAVQGTGLPIVDPAKLVQTSFLKEVSKGGIVLTGLIYLNICALFYLLIPSSYISNLEIIRYMGGVILGFPLVIFLAWRFEKDLNKTVEGITKRNLIKRNLLITGFGLVILILLMQNEQTESIGRRGSNVIEDKSIAVLPFTNMSDDPNQQYFADGMMEDILNHLSKISSLKVISRTSSEKFRDRQGKSLPQIAMELGVAYVLEGSVQKDLNTARITVQLIDAKDDNHLWSENYDRDLDRVFEIQTEISKNIAEVLRATLFPNEQKLLDSKPTSNISAYDIFLKGRESLNKARDLSDENENELAIVQFKSALELDSNLAIAIASLGKAYLNRSLTFDYEDSWIDSALDLSNKAIQIDPYLPNAYLVKGAIYRHNGLYEEAIEAYQMALDLNPNSSESYNILGSLFAVYATANKNLQYQIKALELDPLNPEQYQSVSNVLSDLGAPILNSTQKVDRIFPLIRPKSSLVAAGGRYSADLFLVSPYSNSDLRMSIDGRSVDLKSLQITPDQEVTYGDINFVVTGGGAPVIGETYTRKAFTAEIEFGDSIITHEVEYFVTTPTISIYSREVRSLWKNCANELTVMVPEMGINYNPKIYASNADIVHGTGNIITIIPNSFQKVKMTILNFGDTLGSYDFTVKEVPPPSIEFRFGDQVIDLQQGIQATAIRGWLTVEAIADKNFKLEAPNDARYRIEDVEVFLGRSGSDLRAEVQEKSGRVPMKTIQSAGPRAGEILVFKLNRISRINFKGERERISTRGMVFAVELIR